MASNCDDCGCVTDKPVPVPSVSKDWACCSRCAGKRRDEQQKAPRTVTRKPECIHGTDILLACAECDEMAAQIARACQP